MSEKFKNPYFRDRGDMIMWLEKRTSKGEYRKHSEVIKPIGTFFFTPGQSVPPATSAVLNKTGDVRIT